MTDTQQWDKIMNDERECIDYDVLAITIRNLKQELEDAYELIAVLKSEKEFIH